MHSAAVVFGDEQFERHDVLVEHGEVQGEGQRDPLVRDGGEPADEQRAFDGELRAVFVVCGREEVRRDGELGYVQHEREDGRGEDRGCARGVQRREAGDAAIRGEVAARWAGEGRGGGGAGPRSVGRSERRGDDEGDAASDVVGCEDRVPGVCANDVLDECFRGDAGDEALGGSGSGIAHRGAAADRGREQAELVLHGPCAGEELDAGRGIASGDFAVHGTDERGGGVGRGFDELHLDACGVGNAGGEHGVRVQLVLDGDDDGARDDEQVQVGAREAAFEEAAAGSSWGGVGNGEFVDGGEERRLLRTGCGLDDEPGELLCRDGSPCGRAVPVSFGVCVERCEGDVPRAAELGTVQGVLQGGALVGDGGAAVALAAVFGRGLRTVLAPDVPGGAGGPDDEDEPDGVGCEGDGRWKRGTGDDFVVFVVLVQPGGWGGDRVHPAEQRGIRDGPGDGGERVAGVPGADADADGKHAGRGRVVSDVADVERVGGDLGHVDVVG